MENNREYTEWIIKTRRRFTSKECDRMIDLNFKDNQVYRGADALLFEGRKNYMLKYKVAERMIRSKSYYGNRQRSSNCHNAYSNCYF